MDFFCVSELQLKSGLGNHGAPNIAKVKALVCKLIAGFSTVNTNVQNPTTPTQDYESFEDNGTDGVLLATDQTFTSSSIVASWDGKLIYLKDTVHPENSGVYRFTYVSNGNGTIAYQSTDNPEASTGISWWLCDDDYEVPNTAGDYIQLKTPHTDGWQIQFGYYSGNIQRSAYNWDSADTTWTGRAIVASKYWNMLDASELYLLSAVIALNGEYVNFICDVYNRFEMYYADFFSKCYASSSNLPEIDKYMCHDYWDSAAAHNMLKINPDDGSIGNPLIYNSYLKKVFRFMALQPSYYYAGWGYYNSDQQQSNARSGNIEIWKAPWFYPSVTYWSQYPFAGMGIRLRPKCFLMTNKHIQAENSLMDHDPAGVLTKNVRHWINGICTPWREKALKP